MLLAPLTAEAKTLYVNASGGNDATSYAANGPSAPWATIGRAAWGSTSRSAPNPSEAARAGDVVIVASGTYSTIGQNNRYEVAYNPANSGTASAPITFQAEGTVTLTFSSGQGPIIGAYGPDYIVWRGFTINEVNAVSVPDTGPVVLVDSIGSVIENCSITGLGDNGRQDNYTGIRIDSSSGAIARGNRISNFLGYGRNSAGIEVYYSGRLTFENNEIFNTGSGIFLKGVAEHNDWYIVRYNYIHNIESAGILVHRAPNTATAPTMIYQNVVKDSGAGVRIYGFDTGATDPRNAKIVNNTLVNNQVGFHVLYDQAANAGHVFWNNVISGGTYSFMWEAPLSSLTPDRIDLEHNIYYGPSSPVNAGANNYSLASWKSTFNQDNASPGTIGSNPLFVSSTDYHLQSGSPARNLGIDYLDLNGNGSRSDTINAGAYITGNEIIGRGGTNTSPSPSPAPTPGAPAAPTNVRIIR
ncbi:MAG TPA: right-handed parallel beta-helix repeat-containing protein [Vicinamibacterales bacterium]|nr:right-handed parallel beta-helix repeat-containing protein [Vicinamibacterales bacterium]